MPARKETAVEDALRLLYANDAFLLEADAHERTIVTKLARYLSPHFPEHNVDVEYNRHGLEPKRVGRHRDCRGGGEVLVVPDIVIHPRGNDDENLLVVQVKKSTNPEPRDCDPAAIDAMKNDLGYARGLLVDLPAGPGARDRKPGLEWR